MVFIPTSNLRQICPIKRVCEIWNICLSKTHEENNKKSLDYKNIIVIGMYLIWVAQIKAKTHPCEFQMLQLRQNILVILTPYEANL